MNAESNAERFDMLSLSVARCEGWGQTTPQGSPLLLILQLKKATCDALRLELSRL